MKKRTAWKRGAVAIAAAALLAFPLQAAGETTKPIRLILNANQVAFPDAQPIVKNGTVLVPAAAVALYLNARMSVDNGNVARINNRFSIGALRAGSQTGYVNGIKKQYTLPAQVINKKLYVPIRFIADSLGGSATWNAKDRYVELTYPDYVVGKNTQGKYWFDGTTGLLYYENDGKFPRLLGKVNSAIPPGYALSTEMSVTTIGPDSELVTITNTNGEPMVNLEVYTTFIKKGKILHQMHAHYWQFGPQNIAVSQGMAVMTNGTLIQWVDSEGAITRTVDLTEWFDGSDSFAIEAAGDRFVAVRDSREGLLWLIDTSAGKAVQLYATFGVSPVGFKDDGLRFVRQDGDTVFFRAVNANGQDTGTQYSYTLSGK